MSSELSRLGQSTELYGRSPALEALKDLRAWNALPPEERAKAAAAFVKRKIEEGYYGP